MRRFARMSASTPRYVSNTPRALPWRAVSEGRRSRGEWGYGRRFLAGGLAGLLALGLQVMPVEASFTDTLTSRDALLDTAKIVPAEKRQQTNDDLILFEQCTQPLISLHLEMCGRETGWRIRVLSGYQGELNLTESSIREAWQPDKRTVIVAFDPSSPNIVAFRYIGDEIQAKLKRPFWVELQSRFGNLFFIRQEGEAAAVEGIVESLKQCLVLPEGCGVVPGLSSDQFFATFLVSLAGGVVLGFSSKLEGGALYQRLGWVLVFSPLWLILFVNLGLGPIFARTDDRTPVAINTTAFLSVALVFQFVDFPPKWMKADIPSRKKNVQDDEEM